MGIRFGSIPLQGNPSSRPRSARTAIRSLALVAVGALLSALPAKAAQGLSVVLTEGAVTVTGASPGSSVIYFAVGLYPTGYEARQAKWSSVVDDTNNDGTTVLTVTEGVPWKSIWVAVDLANGHYGVASPPGFPARTATGNGVDLLKASGGNVTRLARAHRLTQQALWVKPGEAAYVATITDGTASDTDGHVNGQISFDAASMTRLTGATATLHENFEVGGTVFLLDSDRLDLMVFQLDEAAIQAAH
jgi:hypothetical protein